MKKIFILSVMALAMGFVSCGNDDDPTVDPNPKEEVKQEDPVEDPAKDNKEEETQQTDPAVIEWGYVDLGLTSKNLWCTCNMYAQTAEKKGNLYSYESIRHGLKFEESWGNCDVPTKDDLIELGRECDWQWTTYNQTVGYKVINKSDATKWIFLPALGYENGALSEGVGYGFYWSKSENSSNSALAWGVKFNSQSKRIDNMFYTDINANVRLIIRGEQ